MPRLRSAGIIIHDNKVLLIHRINEGHEYYTFPGGGCEEGETHEDTLLREVQEEVSLEVTPLQVLYHIHSSDGNESLYYLCKYVEGVPAVNPSSPEYLRMQTSAQFYDPKWIDINEVENLPIHYAIIKEHLIEDIKNGFKDNPKELQVQVVPR